MRKCPKCGSRRVAPILYGWILSIVSKLSQNGIAGFLLADGALSDSETVDDVYKEVLEQAENFKKHAAQ